jgi:hypothetical protein
MRNVMVTNPASLAIRGKSEITLAQAIAYVRSISGADKDKSEAYVREVFTLCESAGYSPEVVISQWAVETGVGTSVSWLTRNNPAGIGITDGGDIGHSWPTPAAAAAAQLVHLSAYVDGYNRALRKHLRQDPRYLLVLESDWGQSVSTVGDLTGKWATDPNYGSKIVFRVEELRGWQQPSEPPPSPTLTFGRVPRPTIIDRLIPDANNTAWDRLGQRYVRGIVYHRQLGTNWGTDGYFRNLATGGRKGLTDYGIDSQTGETLKWNDPWGKGRAGVSPNRSGWASGGSGGESGDGVAFVAKYGRIAINRDLASLEIDRYYDTPLGQAGYDAIVLLSAHLADSALVPWTDYPYNPHTKLVFTYWHNEFQGEKPCPGDVVMKATPQIIADTKQLMKQYQE